MQDSSYDPKTAFLGMKAGMKQMLQQAKEQEPPKGLILADGTPIQTDVSMQAQTCCILLLAFLHNKNAMVPDDFHNVERTKAGIEGYVRPDGGIYLGAFELPKDPSGTVLVWGDPALSFESAAAASIAYRQKLVSHYTEGSELGVFAKPSIITS